MIDPKADVAARQAAIVTLVDAKDPELVPVLQALVSDATIRLSIILPVTVRR